MLKDDIGMMPSQIRECICHVRRIFPDRSNWSEYPNIWYEVQQDIAQAQWYEIYDLIEHVGEYLRRNKSVREYNRFEVAVNTLFEQEGVIWRFEDGKVLLRDEAVSDLLNDESALSLEESEFDIARQELKEAWDDLSRRPAPDLSGAVHHAMAALEAVGRRSTGSANETLGKLIKKNPNLFPSPIGRCIDLLWGYASEHARHGNEDRELAFPEAYLIVAIASALCSYLIKRYDG